MNGIKVYTTVDLKEFEKTMEDVYVQGKVRGISPVHCFSRKSLSLLWGLISFHDHISAGVDFFLDDLYCKFQENADLHDSEIGRVNAWLDKNRDRKISVRGDYNPLEKIFLANNFYEGSNTDEPLLRDS